VSEDGVSEDGASRAASSHLGDALAARQHIGVSEENFERSGRSRIERAERLLLLSALGWGSLKMVDR
jgi:hypothetical protein